jgi:catechol 2,3-dioxygenase-like lactoylglutathione lyase family enzyme
VSLEKRTRRIAMLENNDAVATVAVRDLEIAKAFYEGKLSLKPLDGEEPGVISYLTGRSTLFVYESQLAGTNKATAVTWVVGDGIADVVKALKAKGVDFERYDFPDTAMEGDVHVTGAIKAAWFKDPDGNIHAVVNG